MKLTTESGIEIENPSEKDISINIEKLNDSNNKFMILEKTKMTYIQVYRPSLSDWLLEYQEGSNADHFSLEGSTLSTSKIVTIFHQYLEGNEEWKSSLTWKKGFGGSGTKSCSESKSINEPFRFDVVSKIFLIFVAVGLTISGIGIYLHNETEKYKEISFPVQAEVVKLKYSGGSYRPVYQFSGDGGRLYRYVYHVASKPAAHKVGDVVTIHVNYSDQNFPDSSSVKNLKTSSWISTFLIKLGILFVLFVGILWHCVSQGGTIAMENRGGISALFAERKSPTQTRIQFFIFYSYIFFFGVAGCILIKGIIGFLIGIALSLYVFALFCRLINSQSG